MRGMVARVLFPPIGVRWLVWSLYAAAWTAALLVPVPVKPDPANPESSNYFFLFSKAVHIGAYAFFTILSAWLALVVGRRGLFLGILFAHGVGTEVLQYLLPTGRTGCWQDVLLDWSAVVLGVVLSWKWWLLPAVPVRGDSAEECERESLSDEVRAPLPGRG